MRFVGTVAAAMPHDAEASVVGSLCASSTQRAAGRFIQFFMSFNVFNVFQCVSMWHMDLG